MNAVFMVLDFFLLTWFFWVPLAIFPWVAYLLVINASEQVKYSTGAQNFMLLIVGMLLYRYPSFRPDPWYDWHYWLTWFGGYVGIGFVVCMYKWMMVLWDFRRLPVAADIKYAKEKSRTENPQNHVPAQFNDALFRLRQQYSKCSVIGHENSNIEIYPDRDKYPISSWWSYWPFFVFSVIFDPLTRLIHRIVHECRRLFETVSKCFSIRA